MNAVSFEKTGFRFADELVWTEWRLHRTVLLWQAASLALHLDPDSVRWKDFETSSGLEGKLSVGALLLQRVAQAARHAASDILPCVAVPDGDPEQSTVTLWEFAQWSDTHQVGCPIEMPRQPSAFRAALRSAVRPGRHPDLATAR